MPDLAEGLIDWAANKWAIGPALQILVTNGTLTLAQDSTIEQAADQLVNALIATAAQKTESGS